MSDIALCIIAKNEEAFVSLPIESVKDVVSQIVLLNDHSTDGTVDIVKGYGGKIVNLEQNISEVGFAFALNKVLNSVETEWALVLDADEVLSEPHLLHVLTRYPGKDIWALPRRKWNNYINKERTEYYSYPDWQPKFLKVRPNYTWFDGKMHARFVGGRPHYAFRGPHIEHLQHDCRTEEKLVHRRALYVKLANEQGVNVEGGDLVI